MPEFADQLSAKLSGSSEDYRASAHRNTTIANESGFEAENQATSPYLGPREHYDASLYAGEGDAMRRLFHRDLMRGHMAQRAAIILLMGLLLVLVAAFFHGVFLLRA